MGNRTSNLNITFPSAQSQQTKQKGLKKQAQPNQKPKHNLFDQVKSPFQPKKYKKPIQGIQKQPQDMFAPYMDPYAPFVEESIKYDSDQYQNCEYSNTNYIESLPKRRSGNRVRIDETKTMFFKLGKSMQYSESIYVYAGTKHDYNWIDLEDEDCLASKEIKFSNKQEQINLRDLQDDQKYFMQAGWFVIIKDKFGFLLNMDSLTEAYQGHLHQRWKVLLKYPLFMGIFQRYGQYIEEIYNEKSGQKGTLPREIPTTDFDPFLSEGFIPERLHNQLFLHQKQEVGWMFNMENYPAITIRKKQNAMPFLDTGYYINPSDLSGGFLSEENSESLVDIMVPGGILASQIGSGKTVTVIALTLVGSQLLKKEEIVDEESKMSDFEGSMKKESPHKELARLLDGVYEPTLVIVTKNILGQWAEELTKFAPDLRVAVIENDEDADKLHFENGSVNYNIILTHRKIIERGSQIFEKRAPRMFQTTFRRIIMDEFHELTSLMSKQASGKCDGVSKDEIDMLEFYKTLIRIDRRFTWGITGTPDSLNYASEADSLFRLLDLNQQFNQAENFFKLKDEFVSTCMRKNLRSVDLPALKKIVRNVSFGWLQNILYKGKLNYALDKRAAQEICSHLLKQWRDLEEEGAGKDYIQAGIEAIQAKYKAEICEVEEQIVKAKAGNEKNLQERLRVLKSEGNFFSEVIQLVSQKGFNCPICMEDKPIKDIVVAECMHSLCVRCHEDLKRTIPNPECPTCRESIQNDRLIIHPKFSAGERQNKLTAILKEIEATPKEDKVIIFTQFNNLVEHLSEIFVKKDIQYVTLRGQPSEINMSLQKFKHDPEIKVLLMSVEQAASGINVQEANHVYFAHPVFGMEFEKAAITYNQCIGRAYRIGQKKEVDVKLFVTTESLEEDLVPSFNKYANPLN